MIVFEHEHVTIRTGARSGLPVVVAVHSTVLGQAVGGCRIWRYADWRDGLADALRLSAGMTAKCAVAGLANGGGAGPRAARRRLQVSRGDDRRTMRGSAPAPARLTAHC